MGGDEQLSEVLREFARTMATDFPIQAILDHLVERIVVVLSVTGAGVTLISPGVAPRYVAASDKDALRFERLQTKLGQGPCIQAYETGEAVTVADLAADTRYPFFRPAAVAEGLAAVYAFPLRHGDRCIGALDIYRDTVGELDQNNLEAAQILAGVATAYLVNAQARVDAGNELAQTKDNALHDALTGLPNRLLFAQRLEHAIQRAKHSRAAAAIIFADLDRFKLVNDALGHEVADQLLIAVSRRLEGLIRPGDTLARISGEEFVMMCEGIILASDVEKLATRIRGAFSEPFVLKAAKVDLTASIGVAYAGPGVAVSQQLLVDADTAMFKVKRRGGGAYEVIGPVAAREARDRAQLEQDLQTALGRDGLDVVFQPVVQAGEGLVVGVEALLRWTHPTRGPVPPATAISLAEGSNLIIGIGNWVLRAACEQHVRWQRDFPHQPLTLSVNVSARQIIGAGFLATVLEVVNDTGVDPASIILEVTESVLLSDAERTVHVFGSLRDLGIRIALDDFGIGYSSLLSLRRFPFDIVKVDRAFVADMTHDVASSVIVGSVASLAHALGMTVTAEGVETELQRKAILDRGCELSQGFYFCQPVPAAELSAMLASASFGGLRLPVTA